jgi:hypothetical protein
MQKIVLSANGTTRSISNSLQSEIDKNLLNYALAEFGTTSLPENCEPIGLRIILEKTIQHHLSKFKPDHKINTSEIEQNILDQVQVETEDLQNQMNQLRSQLKQIKSKKEVIQK